MTESQPRTTLSFPVFGEPEQGAVDQMVNVLRDERAVGGALMADHHLGYSMPIGGVVAYKDAISPTGVGFDIGCGNMAVKTDLSIWSFGAESAPNGDLVPDPKIFKPIMREIQKRVAFGLGRTSEERVDHALFEDPTWAAVNKHFGAGQALFQKAREQLGTVGSGNHYVDILVDESGHLWTANHFGSRGLGHTLASGFMAAAAGRDFTDRVPESEDAVVFNTDTDLGAFYIECMTLAGAYAYAGREYVTQQVLGILGATAVETVHNHHNYAWLEDGLWVVRKGATPLTTQPAFIGGSMGDISVIVRGRPTVKDGPMNWVEDIGALNSAPHGAGRVMSRTKAAGKMRKMWTCPNHNCDFEPFRSEGDKTPYASNHCPQCGIPLKRERMRDKSTAAIDWSSARDDLNARGIVVLGAGADESPGVYKDLATVIGAHSNIEVLHSLQPLGVVMAGDDIRDPYKD